MLIKFNDFLLLAVLLGVGETNPNLVVSEDPNEAAHFVIFPDKALNSWQKALHGEHTTYPDYKVGILKPKDLLESLMTPNKELRASELCHPCRC